MQSAFLAKAAASILIATLWVEGLTGEKSLFHGAPYTNPVAASLAVSGWMLLFTGPLIATAPFLVFGKPHTHSSTGIS